MGWTALNIGNSWAASSSTCFLGLEYKNDTDVSVKLTSVTCQLGTTENGDTIYTHIYSKNNGAERYQLLFKGNGQSSTAKLFKCSHSFDSESKKYTLTASGDTIASATVSKTVGVHTVGMGESSGGYHNKVSGDSNYNVTFNFSGITVASGKSVYFGVYPTKNVSYCKKYGIKGVQTTSQNNNTGPILTARKYDTQNITGTVTKFTCAISGVSLNYTSRIINNSVKVSYTSITGSAAYQWQKYNGTNWVNVSGQTSATFTATSVGTYRCYITVTKSGYQSITTTSGSVTYSDYGNPSVPTSLSIVGSKEPANKFTNREDYTFSWAASTAGTGGNTVKHYAYWICANDDNTKITGTTTATSVKKTVAELVSLSLSKDDSLYFKVQAVGTQSGHNSSWATSGSVTIASSAIMHVNVSGSWKDGIVYVNKGTNTNPNWVEATEVKIKVGTEWKDSV